MGMKFLVVNSKGGSGKSTFVMQILAPYFSKKNLKARVLEFDNENQDSIAFTNTKICDCEQVAVDENLREVIMDKMYSDDDLIFDIGGNQTTTRFLEAAADTDTLAIFSAIFIPMTKGEADALNAEKIYRFIVENAPDVPIFFVLSAVRQGIKTARQFGFFLGNEFVKSPLIEKVRDQDQISLAVLDSQSIDDSRIFGKLIYELAQINIQKRSAIRDDLLKTGNMMEAKKEAARIMIGKDAKRYLELVIDPIHEMIDERLKNENE